MNCSKFNYSGVCTFAICCTLLVSLIPNLLTTAQLPEITYPQNLGLSGSPYSMANTSHLVSSCAAYKELLAVAAENLTYCFVSAARPLRFCEDCAKSYIMFKNYYWLLRHDKVKAASGAGCLNTLVYYDRVQVVRQIYEFYVELWNQSYCDKCFDTLKMVNESVPDIILSDTTVKFLELQARTLDCFSNYTNADIFVVNSIDMNVRNFTFNQTACQDCEDVYMKFNQFYTNLEETSDRKVCMDLVDAMNHTRRLWSSAFNCHRFRPQWWWACWPLVCGLVVALLFYCLAAFCWRTKYRTAIYRQKRLRPVGSFSSTVEHARLTASLSVPLTDPVACRGYQSDT